MQVYGMQCIDAIGIEGDFWRGNADGDSKEDEADCEEEKGKLILLSDMIIWAIIILQNADFAAI